VRVGGGGPIIVGGNVIDSVFSYVNPTLYMGQPSYPVTTLVIGNGATAVTPAAKQISFTNASGVDNAAGNATIQAPLSTGAATPAQLLFSVGALAASGASVQTATTVLRLGANPNTGAGKTGQTHFLMNGADIPSGALTAMVDYGIITTSASGSNARYSTLGLNSSTGLTASRYNGTQSVPTTLVSGNVILFLGAAGFDGTNFTQNTADIRVLATETWSTTAHGNQWVVRVVPNGSTTSTTTLTLDQDLSATFAGNVGIGVAAATTSGLRVGATATATSGSAQLIQTGGTLVAGANNDLLRAVSLGPVFSVGSFTGVVGVGLRIGAFSTATWTSPGDPRAIEINVVTGTGATNAYAILISPPTGASNNYLIAHTTPATFNVNAAGTITTGSSIVMGGSGVEIIIGQGGGNSGATFTQDWRARRENASTGDFIIENGAAVQRFRIAVAGATTLGDSASAYQVIIDGTGYGAGVASLRLNGLTSGAAAQVGTLTNAPSAGNPSFWIPINIAGNVRYIPAWT
jgi:hypothetical protein